MLPTIGFTLVDDHLRHIWDGENESWDDSQAMCGLSLQCYFNAFLRSTIPVCQPCLAEWKSRYGDPISWHLPAGTVISHE